MRRERMPLLPAFLFLLALSSLAGCAGRAGMSSQAAKDPMAAGDRYAAMGQPELALPQYDKALAAGGPKAELNLKKADIRFARKEWSDALRDYQAAMAAEPADVHALQGAGVCQFMLQDYQGAEESLGKALAVKPGLGKPLFYLGVISNYKRSPELAIEKFEQAAQALGRTGEICNGLGISYSLLGQYEKACGMFKEALRYSDSKTIYSNLGLTLGQMKQYDLALEYFRLASNEATAYNNVGSMLLKDGQTQKAITYFEKAITLSPTYYAKAYENLNTAKMSLQMEGGHDMSQIGKPWVPDRAIAAGTVMMQQPAATRLPAPKRIKEAKLEDALVPSAAGGLDLGGQGAAAGQVAGAEGSQPNPRASGNSPAADASQAGLQDGWYLMESTWRTKAKAEGRIADLRNAGCQGDVSAIDQGEKGVRYRVLIGPLASQAEAVQYRDALTAKAAPIGKDAMIVSVNHGKVRDRDATIAQNGPK